MRILTVAPRMPYPPSDGYSIAIWGPAAELARRGHELDLLSFCSREQVGPTEIPVFQRVFRVPQPGPSLWNRLIGLTPAFGLPYPVSVYKSRAMSAELRRILQAYGYEVLQFEHLAATVSNPAFHPPPPVKVYRAHNVEHQLFDDLARRSSGLRSIHYRLQSHKLRRFERGLLSRVDLSVAPTSTDAERLSELEGSACVLSIPFGIDTHRLRPGAGSEVIQGLILFTGRMDYLPNTDAVTWFHQAIWPDLKERYPGVRFAVVGRVPSKSIRNLANDKGCIVTGEVEDVLPWFRRAEVVVVPVRAGSGLRLKILEAMATGRPIVTTPLGAEGLELEDREEVLFAESAREFVEAIGALLSDAGLRKRLGSRARLRAERDYGIVRVADRLEAVYSELLSNKLRMGGGSLR